jgi:ElaB/YqjD/DUF883 family membrane-anchored ribosome-binding protein
MESVLPPSQEDQTGSSSQKQTHRENLRNVQNAITTEFSALIADAERLLKGSSSSSSEQMDEARGRLTDTLARARETLKAQQSMVYDQSRAAVQTTEEYVIEHPLKSVGIAAGIGFVVGLLFTRR